MSTDSEDSSSNTQWWRLENKMVQWEIELAFASFKNRILRGLLSGLEKRKSGENCIYFQGGYFFLIDFFLFLVKAFSVLFCIIN